MGVTACDPEQLADPVWERAAGETTKAFDAFTTYLEAGPDRTIKSATDDTGHRYDTARDWAKRWRWRERAGSFDRWMQARRRESFADEYADLGRRHARQAQAALEIIMRPAAVLLRRLQSDPLTEAELEMMDVPALYTLALQSIRLLPQLQTAEQLARGEHTGDTGTTFVLDVEYDDAHMEAVAATLAEIGALPRHTHEPVDDETEVDA